MKIVNLIDVKTRKKFRQWLADNYASTNQCWIRVKKGKHPVEGVILYLDAVEEALCFGWIDSTVKTIDGVQYQRFSPRRRGSNWTELNKERCRRLVRLGLMTDAGLAVVPELMDEYVIDAEIKAEFEKNSIAWRNFLSFHPLYQRVRIDKVRTERLRGRLENYHRRLLELISASEKGQMIGDWNDAGRLLE